MILLSTGSLHLYGIQRVFALAAEVGYDGIEVLINHRADSWQADYLAGLAAEYDLAIAAVHSPFLLNMPNWPAADGQRIERSIKIAEGVSADVVVAHLPTRWPYCVLTTGRRRIPLPYFWKRNIRVATWFEQQLPFLQAETPVTIAVEIMPMHRVLKWPINAHIWNTLSEWSQLDSVTLDTTHCGTWGVDPRKAFDRANGRVRHIHLSNYDGRRQHLLPHQGKLPLDKFLHHITTAGYQGHVTVETSPEAMEFFDEVRVKENLGASLAFCRENLRR